MHAEMFGQAAIGLKLIVNDHFITIEILQAFDAVINGLAGSPFDFSKINK